jgi:hypothetical protein
MSGGCEGEDARWKHKEKQAAAKGQAQKRGGGVCNGDGDEDGDEGNSSGRWVATWVLC